MFEDQSAELVALCASILDDGEITPDEAYQVAEWLNNHSDAAEQWPGNELTQPLQEIWADGVVGKRELHRLARLLISVQREWARHPETQIASITKQPSLRFAQLDVDDVRLPSLQGKFRVPSQSEPGRFYKVDLSGPSCSCPDWRGRRSRLPVGDLTRCCKHIMHVYATLVRKDADGWLPAFIESGWPPHPKAEWHLLAAGPDKVLFCTVSEKDGQMYLRRTAINTRASGSIRTKAAGLTEPRRMKQHSLRKRSRDVTAVTAQPFCDSNRRGCLKFPR